MRGIIVRITSYEEGEATAFITADRYGYTNEGGDVESLDDFGIGFVLETPFEQIDDKEIWWGDSTEVFSDTPKYHFSSLRVGLIVEGDE